MLNHFNSFGEPLTRASETDHLVWSGVIDDPRLVHYLERVPRPPAGYAFSYQDRQQQRFFFKGLLSYDHPQRAPYLSVDLHAIAAVAVRKCLGHPSDSLTYLM